MVIPSTLVMFFQQWQNFVDGYLQRRVWTSLFFAIAWSLWLQRNEMVFQGVSFSDVKLQKLIFFPPSSLV